MGYLWPSTPSTSTSTVIIIFLPLVIYDRSVCVHTTSISVCFISISSLFIFISPTWINTRRCWPNPLWKRVMRCLWRDFPFWMFRRCCCRPCHFPPWLDVSLFPSPHCTTYWLWRRKIVHEIVRAKVFCHWLANFMGGYKKTPDKNNFLNETPSLFTVDVSQAAQYSLFWRCVLWILKTAAITFHPQLYWSRCQFK